MLGVLVTALGANDEGEVTADTLSEIVVVATTLDAACFFQLLFGIPPFLPAAPFLVPVKAKESTSG